MGAARFSSRWGNRGVRQVERRAGGTKGRSCCWSWDQSEKMGATFLFGARRRSEGKSVTSRLKGESAPKISSKKITASRATWVTWGGGRLRTVHFRESAISLHSALSSLVSLCLFSLALSLTLTYPCLSPPRSGSHSPTLSLLSLLTLPLKHRRSSSSVLA